MKFETTALGIGLALVASAQLSGAPVAAADTVPYNDPAVIGSVGLCDAAGHPVTHGTVNAQPFVWRAVSSAAAPNGYGGVGRKATLAAFQPRPGVTADQWNGDTLTSSSSYTNPRYPMAQATAVDFSLKTYLDEYRPMVDGLVQLRLYVSAPDVGVDSTSYAATDIKVTGDAWSVVRGGSVVCTKGSATASEPLPSAAATGGTRVASGASTSTTQPANQSSGSGSASSTQPGAGDPSGTTSNSSAAYVGRAGKSSSGGAVVWVVVGVAVAALGAGLIVWWRRRVAAGQT